MGERGDFLLDDPEDLPSLALDLADAVEANEAAGKLEGKEHKASKMLAELYGDNKLWPSVDINHDVDDAVDRLDRMKERRQQAAAARLEKATVAFGDAWNQLLSNVRLNTCVCVSANDCSLDFNNHILPLVVALDSNQTLRSVDLSGTPQFPSLQYFPPSPRY